MPTHVNLTVGAAFAAVFACSPASATIVLVDASSIQGDNVLFNNGTQTGTTVTGHTQNSTDVNFTGTTTDSNVIRANGGQARVEGDLNTSTQPPNDTFNLTSLFFDLANGNTFNNLEFNLLGGDATKVDFHLTDNEGQVFDFLGQPIGNGSNLFGFKGIDGQSIKSVAWSVNGSGGIGDQRQLRLDEILGGGVPEPGTWGMMIFGMGLVGGVMRRRQRRSVRYDFA
jgi:hypothetical protein